MKLRELIKRLRREQEEAHGKQRPKPQDKMARKHEDK